MASYIFNYNGVNLSNLASVRSVETTDLPPRENHAITIWERPGSIYNSYRYGERDIVVTFLVRATAAEYRSNPNCMDNKLWQLRSVFRVDEPKPLYLGTTSKYILAVPEGDYTVTELRYDCYECKIQFVCHIPEYYAATVSSSKSSSTGSTYGMRNSSNNNTIDVYNSGDASAYPIINISINNDASFIQVENTINGNKFLIGDYPKAGKDPAKTSRIVMNDPMMDQVPWTQNSPYIDEDRYDNGYGDLTKDGSGIMLSSSDGTSLWNGIGGHRSFATPLENFEVRAKMHFNSYGVDGDPTDPQYIDEGTIHSGYREYRYKVIAPSVPIKSSMDDYGYTVDSYDKGEFVYPVSQTITNGWIETDRGYCEAIYFRKYIADSTVTDVAMNVVANKELALMSLPSDDPSISKLLATIDAGTTLRVQRYTEDGYYKLYIPYNGKVGYIDSSNVTKDIDGAQILYPEDEIIVTDDYKTGICEVYGYNSNGTKLFKLCLVDDNQYYSLVKPSVEVGNNVVLEDITAASGSNKANNYNDTDVSYDSLLEGASGNWNNFYGELGIRRKNNKWEAWVYKMEHGVAVKKLILKEQDFSGAPTEKLSYVAIYIGTQDMNNRCGMAITHIQVNELLDDNEDSNKVLFRSGDEIKIDCCNNVVYLNNKLYNNINIDSQFIELVTGNNMLKVTSDDYSAFASVLFNEKYL